VADAPKPTYDLSINLDKLEENAAEQVTMIRAATRQLAGLRRKHAEAKNAQELIEAQLKRAIRSNPSVYGVKDGKITEGAVTETMIVSPKYQEAVKAVIAAKYDVDLCEGLIQSLEHRKRMIEKEVDLWQHSYFAKPNVSANSGPSGANVREAIKTAEKRSVRSKVNPISRNGA
jgi:hypothetical protein